MSSFFRQLGRTLQTSNSARYSLYGAAAAGTVAATWRWNAQSRAEMLERRNAARIAHEKNIHDTQHAPEIIKRKEGEALEAQAPSSTDAGEQSSEEGAPNTGAFDPVTGEINWDCPCLGGMADGPCGPQFRLAFSCFVYSEAEPKGIDCVEKFREMQDCFREHPEIYAEELAGDDDDGDSADPVASTTPPPDVPEATGGEGLKNPPGSKPDRTEPKPIGDDVQPGGRVPPPTPQPKPPLSPPPLPPSDPRPPTLGDPPSSPIPPTIGDPPSNPLPPTIIDPPTPGPISTGGIATTKQRNPVRKSTPSSRTD